MGLWNVRVKINNMKKNRNKERKLNKMQKFTNKNLRREIKELKSKSLTVIKNNLKNE